MGTGPLQGVTVIELAGIGPAPFAGMMLADMGARVVRVGRPEDSASTEQAMHEVLDRGRQRITVDLKTPGGVALVRDLAGQAEVLTEAFRPGVTERLGLGPDELLRVNPSLVYARMTGWGQTGPRALTAGHDLNYIALSGALAPCVDRDGRPVAPLNLLGDFGGGGMVLVAGVLAALLHARATGRGQVVDAAIVDGTAMMTAMHQAMLAHGLWNQPPGNNLLDGGAPFYGLYRTRDDRWLSVAAIEPRFYTQLLDGLGLELDPGQQMHQADWPRTRLMIAERVVEHTLDEWVRQFDGTDACVAPVLTPQEAADDPQLVARAVYEDRGGVRHPAPAPRFAGTPSAAGSSRSVQDDEAVLADLGVPPDRIARLRREGVIG